MLGHIIAGLIGFAFGILTVGSILFVKMARKNRALEKWQRRIADGVSRGLAMQQTIHGPELEEKHEEYTRTRQMQRKDAGLHDDSDLISEGDLGA